MFSRESKENFYKRKGFNSSEFDWNKETLAEEAKRSIEIKCPICQGNSNIIKVNHRDTIKFDIEGKIMEFYFAKIETIPIVRLSGTPVVTNTSIHLVEVYKGNR